MLTLFVTEYELGKFTPVGPLGAIRFMMRKPRPRAEFSKYNVGCDKCLIGVVWVRHGKELSRFWGFDFIVAFPSPRGLKPWKTRAVRFLRAFRTHEFLTIGWGKDEYPLPKEAAA